MMKQRGFSAALKRVELLGTTGVFVLGVGSGAWFGEPLAKYAIGLLIVGGLMHALSMYGKHRLETARGMAQPLWYRILYWLCWVLLAMLAAGLVLSLA
jgi:hypothetical protein